MFASDGTGLVPEAAIVRQVQQLNERFRAFAGGVRGIGNDTMIQFHLPTEDEFGNPSTGLDYPARTISSSTMAASTGTTSPGTPTAISTST